MLQIVICGGYIVFDMFSYLPTESCHRHSQCLFFNSIFNVTLSALQSNLIDPGNLFFNTRMAACKEQLRLLDKWQHVSKFGPKRQDKWVALFISISPAVCD